jgi:hypothetical protein
VGEEFGEGNGKTLPLLIQEREGEFAVDESSWSMGVKGVLLSRRGEEEGSRGYIHQTSAQISQVLILSIQNGVVDVVVVGRGRKPSATPVHLSHRGVLQAEVIAPVPLHHLKETGKELRPPLCLHISSNRHDPIIQDINPISNWKHYQ